MSTPTATPVLSAVQQATELRRRVARNVEAAERDIAAFAAKLPADPARALSWSESAFKTAAQVKVGKQVLAVLENAERYGKTDEVVELIHHEATENVLRVARYPARSTSVASNLMEQEVAAAWAALLETLKFL